MPSAQGRIVFRPKPDVLRRRRAQPKVRRCGCSHERSGKDVWFVRVEVGGSIIPVTGSDGSGTRRMKARACAAPCQGSSIVTCSFAFMRGWQRA